MPLAISAHRVFLKAELVKRYDDVGTCIYCRRSPPDVVLTDEHIIPDGLRGDLLLPKSSCLECAKVTGRVEQWALRHILAQPRGALGVKSRKKRPKQTHLKMKVGPENDQTETEVPFMEEMPAFLILFTSDLLPGILRGASKDEPPQLRVMLATQSDFNERGKKTIGEGSYRYGMWMHVGVFGQMIAKICHAYAVAVLGLNGFEPFLTSYILASEPEFDGFRIASIMTIGHGDELHDISISYENAPIPTAVGTAFQQVYVVRFRLFAPLNGPAFICVVGKKAA